MTCVKQSDTRSSCKVIDGNGTVTDHIFEYNQACGIYKFGDIYVATPSIAYNGSYHLMIKPPTMHRTLGCSQISPMGSTILGFEFDSLPSTPRTLTLIEQGYNDIFQYH